MRQQAIEAIVSPVRASLERVDSHIHELEKARTGAYATLHEQVRSLLETQTLLRTETGKLVTALRTPGVRGRWGEVQLRRVVEMAGMLDHCDFTTQSTSSYDDVRIRPDLLVMGAHGHRRLQDLIFVFLNRNAPEGAVLPPSPTRTIAG